MPATSHPSQRCRSDLGREALAIKQAAVVSVREWLPSTFDPVGATLPVLEEFRILAGTITVTNTKNGTEHTISTIETD